MLGSRWVARRGGDELGTAARDALAKIAAVLPPGLREEVEGSTLLVGPVEEIAPTVVDLGILRRAIREERKLVARYRDASGADSERILWPFALAFFDRVRIVVAWCEARDDIRHFRADRLVELAETGIRMPRRRSALLREWREREGIPPP